MAEQRRTLVEGLAATPPASDKAREREFVHGDKLVHAQAPPQPVPIPPTPSRAPFTARLREDYAKTLKRASLERQLAGMAPNTLQDILEEAIASWLKANRYLSE